MGQLVRWLAVGMSILNWFVASGVLLSASALTVSPASPDVISDVNALAANAKSLSSETGSVADDIIGKLNDADKEVKEQEEKLKVAETEKNTELAKLNAEVKSKSDAATASLADANAKVSAVQEKANADVKAAKEQAEQEKTAVKNKADKEKAAVVAQAEREKQKLEFEASEASRKAAAADQLLADTAAKANNDVANAQAKVDAEVARQTADTTNKAKADVDGAKSAAIKQVSDQNAKLAADKDKAVADGAAAKDAYSSIQNQIRTAKNDVISKISGIFDSLLAKAVAQAQAA